MQHMRTRPATLPHKKLSDLAALVQALTVTGPHIKVSGITLASNSVQPGDLFVAAQGQATHGIKFLEAAIEAGARAVLTDPRGAEHVPHGFPTLVVSEPRAVIAVVAAAIYDSPSDDFVTIGITGTQGKTTSTHIAEAAFGASRSAVVGTIGTRIAGQPAPSALTTPEASELQALFAVMREEQIEACFMEVSSHALVQGRVNGFVFDVAVFLNLGRDHLDFHADIEDYFAAKALLFTPEHSRRAVINVDDEFGRRLAEQIAIPFETFSIEGHEADWQVTSIRESEQGSQMTVSAPSGEEINLALSMPGRFNVSNALATIAALSAGGFHVKELVPALAQLAGVPGRMERIDTGRDFSVVVDYAHKPEAIRAVLSALRPVTAGKLVIVVGAGGDRDRGKRPLMGEISAELADVVIVTDDNPRTEDPARIRDEIVAGIPADTIVHQVEGRRAAIERALANAATGDTIVVAGKGHESGQEIAGMVHPFDDRQVVRELLEELA